MDVVYQMPAEWEPHQGTWLAWPHNKDHWPGKIDTIPPVYRSIVEALVRGEENIFLCVNDASMEQEARDVLGSMLVNSGKVFFYHIPTNSSWFRDHGPIFVRDNRGGLVVTDWIFNAWGRKYPPWDLDDKVPKQIAELFHLSCLQPGIVLEGGSIEVNGKGTLLTTEQCLLNPNRNPDLDRGEIESYLARYLGVSDVIWLKQGIVGDDTDGHVDDIARFVAPSTVVCCLETKPEDENYHALRENYQRLQIMKDQDGHLFNLIALPMPEPVIFQGERLPASYANFYIANKAVIVPIFRSHRDTEALQILQKVFPTREVIGIDCVDLVWGLGAIHCLTQQQPLEG